MFGIQCIPRNQTSDTQLVSKVSNNLRAPTHLPTKNILADKRHLSHKKHYLYIKLIANKQCIMCLYCHIYITEEATLLLDVFPVVMTRPIWWIGTWQAWRPNIRSDDRYPWIMFPFSLQLYPKYLTSLTLHHFYRTNSTIC